MIVSLHNKNLTSNIPTIASSREADKIQTIFQTCSSIEEVEGVQLKDFKIERVFEIEHIIAPLKTIRKENKVESTIYLKFEKGEIFPLKAISSTCGFEFRIPLKDGLVNKAFHFYTFESRGRLVDLYPDYGIKKDYKLRGYDLMKLIDRIAEAFELSEISLEDKSSCSRIDGIEKYKDLELENELVRFANLHNLSLEKDDENNYCSEIIDKYADCLSYRPRGFHLKYSRAMIKGNSWYGAFGYYPLSMTSDEYLEFIAKLRATDLSDCFSEEISKEDSLVKLLYREFSIHESTQEHSLGNFFIWLNLERPHTISDIIREIRGGYASLKLQKAFYDIEDFSTRMLKKFNW